MDQAPVPERLPASLRLLKWLVIVLTLTMILGVITIVGLIVTRMPKAMEAAAPAALSLPDRIALPEGSRALAFTQGRDWFAVVVAEEDGSERILIHAPDGSLRQSIALTGGPGG